MKESQWDSVGNMGANLPTIRSYESWHLKDQVHFFRQLSIDWGHIVATVGL